MRGVVFAGAWLRSEYPLGVWFVCVPPRARAQSGGLTLYSRQPENENLISQMEKLMLRDFTSFYKRVTELRGFVLSPLWRG